VTAAQIVLAGGVLFAAAVGASLVADRLRIPALLLFLGVGVAAGSDGTGWIELHDYALVRDLGVLALAAILFNGGLQTGLSGVRKVLVPSLRLAVGATVMVAVVTGVVASLLLGKSLVTGLLLGSILASTDSAAVFGLLRGSTLRRRLVRTMEGEAALNDAVVLVLVPGFIAWISHSGYGIVDMMVLAARELGIGVVCGLLVAKVAVTALERVRVPRSGLYAVSSFAIAALAYGAAASLDGSALIAVYVAGLVLADARLPGRQTMASFHDGLAWVAQVGLFVLLGLLVSPSRLSGAAISNGLLLALVVVLVARPVATMAMTSPREFRTRERIVLSWAELLGATPIVFASFAVASGTTGSLELFDIVTVAVVVSALLQGLTFEPLARGLGLTRVVPPLPRPLAEFGGPRRLGAEIVEYPVAADDAVVGRHVADLALPLGITLALIVRGDEAVSPSGSARLGAGDVLHLLVREEVAWRIPELLARLRTPRLAAT
jgi:cell volume regulation protein A